MVAAGFNPDNALVAILLLLLSTAGLYGGGVVLNDVFDAKLDAVERPERPIPSGRVKKSHAAWLGIICLGIGLAAAIMVHLTSFFLAVLIAVLALVYDRFTKPFMILGPVNMALCRVCNLWLGMSIVTGLWSMYWMLGLIHLFYILAVTLISKSEVHANNRGTLTAGFVFYLLALTALVLLFIWYEFDLMAALPFLLILAIWVFSALWQAMKAMSPGLIRRAVVFGILGLIFLDAAIVAGAAGWMLGAWMLLLLPVSYGLGRLFAVT